MREIWKDIPGYENYEISNLGRVKTKERVIERWSKPSNQHSKGEELKSTSFKQKEKIREGYPDYKGYLRISINGKMRFIHQLIALAFIPNPENKPFVNHKDNNGLNNCIENLEWVTHKENMEWANKQGRVVGNSKARKEILQFDLNNNFIKEFPSARQAERETGVANTNIISCCKGKYKQTNGFIWKYK